MESPLPTCIFVRGCDPNFYHRHRLHDAGLSPRSYKDVLDDAYVGRTRVTSRVGALHHVHAGYVLQRWDLP